MEILNNRDARKILVKIEEQWDCKLGELLQQYSLVVTEKKKVYIINREMHTLSFSINSNAVGLYIANIRDKEIRLTIEGSQLIGPKADKNVVEISEEEAKKWIRGNDLEKEGEYSGYVIVKNVLGDYMGCGHYKEGKITNFVPKTRRIMTAE